MLSLASAGVLQAQVMTQTLSYTGSAQTFTLPNLCTNQVTITCFGASGAAGSTNSGSGSPGGSGGNGARVSGIYNMTSGTVLNIFVGGVGTGSLGGFNGGGNGASNNSGAGGGASDVRVSGTGLGNRVIVAGGGGGGGNGGCYSATLPGGNGGNSGINGSNGANSPAGGGGFGGSGSNGGAAGVGCTFASGTIGGNGASGTGGSGGNGVAVCSSGFNTSGGGGGGGYVGGGGGGGGTAGTSSCTLNDTGGGGGGAGGTSYTSPAATNTVISNGINSGNGYIVVSYFAGNVVSVVASSTTICSGNSVTLTASGVTTYTWVSPASNSSSVVVSPGTTTGYTVSGTNGACISSAATTVSVNVSPVISLNSNSITCAGSSVVVKPSGANTYTISGGSFTVNPVASTNYTVSGTASNGCISTNTPVFSASVNALPTVALTGGAICSGNTFTMLPSGANTYTVTGGSFTVSPSSTTSYSLTGTSAQGCAGSNTAVATITVNTLPAVASTVTNSVICSGNTTTLNGTGALTYTWTNGVINGAAFSPTITTTYTVTGADANSCTNTSVRTITVNPLPLIAVGGNSVICAGSQATLTASGATSYTWSTSAISNSIAVSPTLTSSYSVSGTNTQGCTGTALTTVTVSALPVIAITGPSAICSGQTATLTAGGATTYSWATGATSASVSVSPALTATYSVVGTNTAGCTGSLTRTLVVNALPNVTATSNASMICSGQSATLTASGGTTYSWNTGATNSSVVVSPTVGTTYTVQGTDANGCSKSATVTQSVSACTGIEALLGSNGTFMNVYPNPTSGQFTIELSSPADLSVINVVGQEIIKEKLQAGKHNLDLGNEARSIYFVSVVQNGKTSIVKLLKQ